MSTRLRLFPLNAVLFPGAVLNLHVFEPRYKQMIGECIESGENFGVVLIRDGREAGDPSVEPHQIGSVAEIVEVSQLPFGRFYISAIGRQRFRIRSIVSREPYLTVDADILEDKNGNDGESVQLQDDVRDAFLQYLDLIVQFSGQQSSVDLPADPQSVSYAVGDALQVADSIKQRLLELDSTKQRLRAELGCLERLLPQLRELLQRREQELQARKERGDDQERRGEQERYFGKYFSVN
ncbi:MAG TPA: LON peptidase substrate-binding domain-containing protein [Candidatus Baltobacteraceae bacterium]|jgi:Lon protease-like protein|nr:LON peptidase substrate-binding domain-containing protein [Candidatus Baltobacteraceae bacterium]